MASSASSRVQKRNRSRIGRRARQHQQRIMWVAAAGAVVVLAVAIAVYVATRPQPGVAVATLGNDHIQPPLKGEYNTRPPTSGPHYTTLAPWGVHNQPIPNEVQVHNLEDGGVLVQYNCPQGCPELVQPLAAIVERYGDGVILAPYPDMEARIALTAWGRMDTMEALDEQRVEQFIRAYRGIDHHDE